MSPSTTIIGCDARPGTLDAVALAQLLDPDPGSRLILATAVPHRLLSTEIAPEARAAGEQVLSHVAGRLDGRLVERRIMAMRSPAHALVELAEQEHAELIVVGSGHGAETGRVKAGAVTRRLLADAPCAVAIAPAAYSLEAPAALRRVGVAWDEGPEASAAAALARRLPLADEGGVRLLHVLGPEALPALWGYEGLAYALAVEPDLASDNAQRRLDKACAAEGLSGDLLEGEPATELVAASSELDLLVLGSRGYGPVLRVALGSVSAGVLHRARCPLLVVPRAAKAAHADDVAHASGLQHDAWV